MIRETSVTGMPFDRKWAAVPPVEMISQSALIKAAAIASMFCLWKTLINARFMVHPRKIHYIFKRRQKQSRHRQARG